jgi:hypothetical protein
MTNKNMTNETNKKLFRVSITGILVKAINETDAITQFSKMVSAGEFEDDFYEVSPGNWYENTK